MRKLLVILTVFGAFAIAAPALAADATISGTVTHASDGTAVSTMWLYAKDATTGLPTTLGTSAADGTYSGTLAPGTYDVYNGTSTSVETGVYFLQKTITMTVASGEVKSGQNFALTRRGRFTGHVYASDGVTLISGATVYAYGSSGTLYTSTLSNGSYLGSPLLTSDYTVSSVGVYTFYITKAGYFGTMVANVALAADETTVTQDFRLTPGSTVTGTIRDSNGAAIDGAIVTLTKTTGALYTAPSNAAGTYSISVYDLTSYNGTAVADYTLSVSKTGYVTKSANVSIVTDASALSGNDLVLATAGTITGTVTSSGTGLAGVAVAADDGFGNTSSATTDATGAYTLSSLRPSTRYTLTATKTNYVGQKMYAVSVSSGATTSGKNFSLPAATTFSGKVVAKSGGALLEGAVVSLFKRNKTRSEVADFSFTTKSDGAYVFRNVSPGKYRVKVVKSGYITMLEEALAISSNVANKNYRLDLGGLIRGRVYTGTNTGIASADIAVYAIRNGKETAYASASSDENGNYIVSGLKQGTYRLKVTTTDYVQLLTNVAVKTGATAAKNLKLAPAGSISGYVMDKETGLPVVGYVKVVGTVFAASSDSNGMFILDGVAPGKRKITVISAYYEVPLQLQVVVTAGKTRANANFTLTPKQ